MTELREPPPAEPKGRRKRRGSETRQKQYRTTVRWNEGDYTALVANAERAGQTVGTFIRAQSLARPTTRTRRAPTVDILALAKVLAAVNRMGGNLHQLVRHLNFGGMLEEGELRAALRGYEAMVTALMTALGRQP
jgi:hypothetical protein